MSHLQLRSRTNLLLASALLAAPAAAQAHWPSFRGPSASGVAAGPEPPFSFHIESGEDVRWQVDVPGLAHSAPVIWGQRLFLTTAVRDAGAAELSSLYGSDNYGAGDSVPDEGEHAYRVLCLDKDTGELYWSRDAHVGAPRTKRHPKSTHANSTPACDAERVVAFFGSEGLHAYDHAGEHLWSVDLGQLDAGAPSMGEEQSEQYQWGFASSPVLHDGRVIVQCDVQEQSFLAALDAASGEELWRVERDEEPTWGSPTIASFDDAPDQILVNGFFHVGGYAFDDGAELWRLAGGGDVPVPTPVLGHGNVYLTSAHGRSRPLTAISLDARGEISRDPEASEHAVWNHARAGVYMQTPLLVGDELYVCSDGGILSCYDAQSGEQRYRQRLGDGATGFSSSPVAAGEHIYLTGESGQVTVVAAGPEFELIATSDLEEPCLATPAIADGVIYFRTRHRLIAIGAEL